MWSVIGILGVLAAPPPPFHFVVDDLRAGFDAVRKHPHIKAALTRGDFARIMATEGGTAEDTRAMLDAVRGVLPQRFEMTADAAGARWVTDRLLETAAARGDGRLTIRLTGVDCESLATWAELGLEALGEAPTVQCSPAPLLHFGAPLPGVAPQARRLVGGRWDLGDGPMAFEIVRKGDALAIDGRMAAAPSAKLPAPPPNADFVIYDDSLDVARRLSGSPVGALPALQTMRGVMMAIRHVKPRQLDLGEGLTVPVPIPEAIAAVGTTDADGLLALLRTLFAANLKPIDLGLGLPTWHIDPAASPAIERFAFNGMFHLVHGPGWIAFGTDPAWTKAALRARLPKGRRYVFRGKRDGLIKFAADAMLTSWRFSSEQSWTLGDTGMWTVMSDLARAFTLDVRIDDAKVGRRLSGAVRWAASPFSPTFDSAWSPAKVRDWLTSYCDAKAWVHGNYPDIALPRIKTGAVFGNGPSVNISADGSMRVGRVTTTSPTEALRALRAHWPVDFMNGSELFVFADAKTATRVVESVLIEAATMGFVSSLIIGAGDRVDGPDEPDVAFEARLGKVKSREEYLGFVGRSLAQCNPMRSVIDVPTAERCAQLVETGVRTLPWCTPQVTGELLTILPQFTGPGWTGHLLPIKTGLTRISSTHPKWGDAAAALIKQGAIGLK